MVTNYDKRIVHPTVDTVVALLARKHLPVEVLTTNNGSRMVCTVAHTPAARLMLGQLSFSHSAKYGYWYRTYKRPDAAAYDHYHTPSKGKRGKR